jgi:hypothetical protein
MLTTARINKAIIAKTILILIFATFSSSALFAEDYECLMPPYCLPQLSPRMFNDIAVQNKIYVQWDDKNKNKLIEPTELYANAVGKDLNLYIISSGKEDHKEYYFTNYFEKLYREMVELKRQETIAKELLKGVPLTIESDFRSENYTDSDRCFVKKFAEASLLIEDLYQTQRGTFRYKRNIPGNDTNSILLYERNQGVWCETEGLRLDPFCNADPSFPERKSDAYPADLKHDSDMCKSLRSEPNGTELISPFAVVRKNENGEGFIAIPFNNNKIYGHLMKKVASKLDDAAGCYSAQDEEKLQVYLRAAASGFRNNRWDEADIAWYNVNAGTSRWFVRIAPDETDYDICGEKAGFQAILATYSRKMSFWQEKLEPVMQKMEGELASLIAHTPYRERTIKIRIPEFIEIMINAGDSRKNLSGWSGKMLPNWGRLVDEGKTRAVLQVNLDDDKSIVEENRQRAGFLFSNNLMANYDLAQACGSLSIVLHALSHNIGPQMSYRVGGADGKDSRQIFGGRVATILEELKAKLLEIWLSQYLVENGIITHDQMTGEYINSLEYMYKAIATNSPSENHRDLSIIVMNEFLKSGAVRQSDDSSDRNISWELDADFNLFHESAEKLLNKVLELKVLGGDWVLNSNFQRFIDPQGATRFITENTRDNSLKHDLIREMKKRFATIPLESFAYSVRFFRDESLNLPARPKPLRAENQVSSIISKY